jgi:hypothetical protein
MEVAEDGSSGWSDQCGIPDETIELVHLGIPHLFLKRAVVSRYIAVINQQFRRQNFQQIAMIYLSLRFMTPDGERRTQIYVHNTSYPGYQYIRNGS